MRRDVKERVRGFEAALEQAAIQWIDKTAQPREAGPMTMVDLVPPEALSVWFAYILIRETKRVEWLTIVLIVLTAVLAILTFQLAVMR